nr:hypothetical protein [Streptococcus suis]
MKRQQIAKVFLNLLLQMQEPTISKKANHQQVMLPTVKSTSWWLQKMVA